VRRWVGQRLWLLAGIAAVMILLQLVNSLSGQALNGWGLLPRHLGGLPGVLLAPWLHGGWAHLASNLPGLLVLGWLAMLGGIRSFLAASAFIIVGSGLLVWLFGRPTLHVGASGWLFGLWAMLIMQGWYLRSGLNLLVAALVLFYYGGWIIGLLPRSGVSFEYHLAGMLCGGFYAALARPRRPA